MATPTLVDHKSTSANYSGTPAYPLGAASAASNSFTFSKPNASLSGNCLILVVNCPYLSTRTITITDNKSNSWPSVVASTNNGTTMTSVFVLPNAIAATQTFTVAFDTNLQNCTFKISEWYNVATSAATDVTKTATTTGTATIATGSVTTGTSGDLIYHIGFSTQSPSTGTTNITGITAGSGFTLLSSCVYLGSFDQYQVQSSAGAINPTATLTGSTDSFNTVAIALKSATAGTAPTIAIRVVREYHVWADRNTPVQFPTSGNLIFFADAAYYDSSYAPQWLITGLTDTQSNTYVATISSFDGGKNMPQCFYAANSTPSNTLKITIGGLTVTYGTSCVFYDIIGADVSPVGNQNNAYVAGIPGSATTNTSLLLYTPAYAEELVFFSSAIAVGTLTGHFGSAAVVWDTVNYTGQIPTDLMDNVDAYAHVHLAGGSIAFGTIDHNVSATTDFYNASAIGFRASGSSAISVPKVVQKGFGKTLVTPTLAQTFLNNTTTGNTLVVIACGYDGATVRSVSSIAINAGTATFAKVIGQVGSANNYTCIEAWAAPNITGGTTPKITVTFSGAITDGVLFIYELANMPTTVITDGTASGKAGTAATALTSPSITTTNAWDIIFSAFSAVNVIFPGQQGWFMMSDAPATGNLAQVQVVTSTQSSLAPTATEVSSGVYGAITLALKAAAVIVTLHFPMAVVDTTAVLLDSVVSRHFPMAIVDTTSVAGGFVVVKHFPMVIAGTSLVTKLQFEAVTTFTAGNTTQGTNSGAFGGYTAVQISASQGGTLQSISIFWGSAGVNFLLGLYSDISGQPGALLASSAVASSTIGLNTLPITSGPTISSGSYWLNVQTQGNISGYWNTGGSGYFNNSPPPTWTGSLLNPWPLTGAGSGAFNFSLYATFATSVATLHFPMAIVDTTNVTGGFVVGPHFPMAVVDTSSVTLDSVVSRRFPMVIVDTSSVTLGSVVSRRFPMVIADTSIVTLTFGGVVAPFTAGNINQGANSGAFAGITSVQITLSQGGALNSISIWLATPGINILLGLYSDAGGKPGVLLASSAITSSVIGLNTLLVSGGPAVPAGACWLAVMNQSNVTGYWDTGSGSSTWNNSWSWTGSLPGTFPFVSGNTAVMTFSLYATFTPSAAPLHFPMVVASTSNVTLGLEVKRRFPMAFVDTSNVILTFEFTRPGTFVSNGSQLTGQGTNDSDTVYVPGHAYSVQHCHDQFASNGDIITIPSGTFNWTGTVQFTKAITLKGNGWSGGANTTDNIYHPLTGTILQNSIANQNPHWIIGIVTSTGGNTTIRDLAIIDFASLTINYVIPCHIFVSDGPSGSGIPIFLNCYMENGAGGDVNQCVDHECVGGVYSGCTFYSNGNDHAAVRLKPITGRRQSWQSASTLGSLDTTGLKNVYIEQCFFRDMYLQAIDSDQWARVVVRNNIFRNSATTTHGDTDQDVDGSGGRQFEFYNNTCTVDGSGTGPSGQTYPIGFGYSRNQGMVYWHYSRGGVHITTGNTFGAFPSQLGSKACWILTIQKLQRNSGALGCWSTNPALGPLGNVTPDYPAPFQPGWGSDGTTIPANLNGVITVPSGNFISGYPVANGTLQSVRQILDPCYTWSNIGTSPDKNQFTPQDYGTGQFDSCQLRSSGAGPAGPSISGYIQLNREYYNGVASPTWAPYTYPHPLTQAVSSTTLHFPVYISDNSTTTLGFRVARDFLLRVADISTVTLRFDTRQIQVSAVASIVLSGRVLNAPFVIHRAQTGILIGIGRFVTDSAAILTRVKLVATGTVIRSSASVSILMHTQLPALVGSAVTSVSLGRAISANARVLSGAKATISPTFHVSDTSQHIIQAIAGMALKSTIGAGGHAVKLSTVSIGTRVGIIGHARVGINSTDIIRMAMGIVARAFPHYAVRAVIGTKIGVVAIGSVPQGVRACQISLAGLVQARARIAIQAAENIQIGAKITATPRISRRSPVNISMGMHLLLAPRNLTKGIVGMGMSGHVNANEGRGSYGLAHIGTSTGITAHAASKSCAVLNLRMSMSTAAVDRVRIGGYVTVKMTMGLLANMLRSTEGVIHIGLGTTIQAAGARNSLGGIQSQIVSTNPTSSITQLSPISTISVI